MLARPLLCLSSRPSGRGPPRPEAEGSAVSRSAWHPKSMCLRAHQRAEIDSDSERIIVELQRHAAAVVEFKVQVINRLEVDARFVSVVASQARAAGRNAGTRKSLAIGGRAAAATLRRRP